MDLLIEAVASARHQARLQAGHLVAHLAFEPARDQRRTDGITRCRPRPSDQGVGDLEPLLASVGLRDQEVVDVDAELAGIDRPSACSHPRQMPPFCASATQCSASVVLPRIRP